MTVVETCALPIASADDVTLVSTRVRDVAQRLGFDPFAVAAITTAASELTRNTWIHGGGGYARVDEIEDAGRRGVRLEFRDEGPGIEDVERAMSGGCAQTLGIGLSGTRRLVDEFQIDSRRGVGTHIVVAKWARFGPPCVPTPPES